MSKFRVGDIVTPTEGGFSDLQEGQLYTVCRVRENLVDIGDRVIRNSYYFKLICDSSSAGRVATIRVMSRRVDPGALIYELPIAETVVSINKLHEGHLSGHIKFAGDVDNLYIGETPPGHYRTDVAKKSFQLGTAPVIARLRCDVEIAPGTDLEVRTARHDAALDQKLALLRAEHAAKKAAAIIDPQIAELLDKVNQFQAVAETFLKTAEKRARSKSLELPTAAGFYWAKWQIADQGDTKIFEYETYLPRNMWRVVEVFENSGSSDPAEKLDPDRLRVFVSGVRDTQSLENFFWGPGPLPPPGNAA